MERSLLIIVAMVFVVAVVGFLTIMPHVGGSLTGHVVAQRAQSDPCDRCAASNPVCAIKYDTAITYQSACMAQCDAARVIYADRCDAIPRASGGV